MDANRKVAYRKVLYNFLIQIKQSELPDDATTLHIGRYAAPVAYALHNFALASANDFVGFDEAAFWKMLDGWEAQFPGVGFSSFRQMFEWDLAE